MEQVPAILFVNPPALQLWRGMRTVTHKFPPLGLAYLASYLEQFGIQAQIFDAFAQDASLNDIASAIAESAAEYVGITATSATIGEAIEIAYLAHRYDKKVILGGPHASACSLDVLRAYDCVDYVVAGEGEVTLSELLKGADIGGINGLAYRQGTKVVINPARAYIDDISSIPHPARHLLNNQLYHPADRVFSPGKNFYTMMTSRGCPFACDFCASSVVWGSKIRLRNLNDIFSEIDELYNEGMEQLWIIDDTFTIDNKRVESIAATIKDYAITWGCNSRVDAMTKELALKLKESNCIFVKFGIESGSQSVLNAINKRINIQQARQAVQWVKEAGIKVSCSFIIGHLYDTHESINETIDFACSLKSDFAEFSMLVPYPGTQVYRLAKEKGLLVNDFLDYKNPKYGNPVLRIPEVDPTDVKRLMRLSYRRFYLSPRYLLNIFGSSLSSLQEVKRTIRFVKAGLYLTLKKGSR